MRYWNLIRTFSNWPLYFGFKSGLVKTGELEFHTRSGLRIFVPAQLIVEFKEIFFSGAYSRGFESLGALENVVDIGANVGFFSMFALHEFKAKNVFAYEPVPANYSQLTKNTSANRSSSVRTFRLGVSRESGPRELSLNSTQEFTTAATVGGLTHESNTAGNIVIDCVDLRTVVTEHVGQPIDLLKLDCEGSEYDILYNGMAVLPNIRRIVAECHHIDDKNQNQAALASFLRDKGYRALESGPMIYATRSSAYG
ncbi:MAG: FkbM family methyltransferase [Burkholderiales bacterium]